MDTVSISVHVPFTSPEMAKVLPEPLLPRAQKERLVPPLNSGLMA